MTPYDQLNSLINGSSDYSPYLRSLGLANPAGMLSQFGLNPAASNWRIAEANAQKAGAIPIGFDRMGKPVYSGATGTRLPLGSGPPPVIGSGGGAPPPPPPGSRGGVTPITTPTPSQVLPRGGTPTTSTSSMPPITPVGSTTPMPVIGTRTDTGSGGGTGAPDQPDYGKLFSPTGYDGTDVNAGPSISSDSLMAAPAQPGAVDYSRLFSPTGYDGNTVGYDAADYTATYAPGAGNPYGATTPNTGGVLPYTGPQPTSVGGGGMMVGQVPNTFFPTNTSGGGSAGNPSTMPGGFPSGAVTLGGAMYPWLQPYNGNFTATMTPYENQGLNAISQFVGGGENLGGAQGYLSNVLSGQYLDPSTNPNLAKYVSSLSGIHDYQDELERERIGSSMAAGGNALSGARVMAEQQYQNESNNQYQNMIAQMLNSNYQMERGLQNQAVPLQMGVSNELMGGFNNLMGAGAVPRSIQQAENQAEYNDWLRQISGMQQAFQQPENTMLSLLHAGYPGSQSLKTQPSAADTWLAALMGNGTAGSGLINTLFGSGTTGGGTGGSTGLIPSLLNLLGIGGGSTDQNTGSLTDPNNPYGNNYGGGVSTGQNYGPDAGASGYDPYAGDPYFDPSNYANGMTDAEWAQLLNAFGYSNQGSGQ